jgi:uncharacterized protein (TIRG00374 family)
MMETQEVSKGISHKDIFVYIRSKKRITKLLSLGFGILLISWLLSQLDISASIKIIRELPISLLIVGFLCYALGFYLRAIRFRLLLPPEKSVKHLFPIVLVHYTALNIIPARLGELSYIYLLKKVNNISTGCSVSNLLIARVFDQITISLLFLVSWPFMDLSSQWMKTLSLFVSGFLILMTILLMGILAYKEKCIAWIKILVTKFGWANTTIIRRIIHEMEEVVIALRGIQVKKNAATVLGVSVLIWMSIWGSNYALLQAFQVDFTYVQVIFSSTCIILLRVLPLQVVSGLGIHETTWVFIALALGISKDIAITAAFGSHILSIIYLLIFGTYGVLRLGMNMSNDA